MAALDSPQELTRSQRWGIWAARFLQGLATRVFLSICITLSLIPVTKGWAIITDSVFLTIFTIEFFMRLLSLKAPEEDGNAPGRRRLGTIALLVVDFVALLTFIPWTDDRSLRLLRLLRIILLLGYWAPLLRDIAAILRREDRMRQVVLMGFAVATVSLVGAVILDALAVQGVDFDNDGKAGGGDEGFLVRLWWAFRQIQDPGNMISSPLHAAALGVSLTLTVFGLFMISFLIGLGTSVVSELVTLSRHRPPGFHNHTVLVGLNASTQGLLVELLRYYQKLFTVPRYALLGNAPDRPDYLDDPLMTHVVYRQGPLGEPGFLERVDTARARRVVIMPDLHAGNPDAETAGFLLSVREKSPGIPVVAEVVDLANAPAARVAGGVNTTLVGTERLLGLTMFASAHRPGLVEIVRILMSSEGRELYTYLYDRPDAHGGGSLPVSARPRLDALLQTGLRRSGPERVFPLGFITFDTRDTDTPPTWKGYVPPVAEAIVLNGDTAEDVHHLRGIIAIAESFSGIEVFARDLEQAGLPAAPDATTAPFAPTVDFEAPGCHTPFKRVVILGYRPAVISLIEALIAAHPGVDILLCVHNQRGRDRARAALSEHSLNLADASFPGMAWRFSKQESTRKFDTWTCMQADAGASDSDVAGHLRVEVTDWTNDAVLTRLPGWDCSIGETDAAFLAGGLSSHGDGWTALAVLKIAELRLFGGIPFKPEFRVIAQVNDPGVGRRLETRFHDALGMSAQIRVLSSRTLRSYAMLQGLAVPAFEAIYAQLLGPWGQSFQRIRPVPDSAPGDRELSFLKVAKALHRQGMLLVAVELRPAGAPTDSEPRLYVCPLDGDDGETFQVSSLVAAWVIAEARGPEGAAPVEREGSPSTDD